MRMLVAFEKTARVRHIGHLDMQRAMQRALRRSGLPVQYSQGFNPHVVLSFASPLPVGMAGREELFDVAMAHEVEEAAFCAALAPALPASLPLVRVRAVPDTQPALMAQLRRAEYTFALDASVQAEAVARCIPNFLAQETIEAIRKSKSGEKLCDIRPMLFHLTATETVEGVTLCAQVSFTEAQTLKPDLLLCALAKHAGVETPPACMVRQRLFGVVNGLAVPLMDC